MAFNGGRTTHLIQEDLNKRKKKINEKTDHLSNIESKLHGKERKIATGFSLEPSVKEKIKRLAKEHHYRTSSEFVNDVFKYW